MQHCPRTSTKRLMCFRSSALRRQKKHPSVVTRTPGDVDMPDAEPSTSHEDAKPSTSTTSYTIRAQLEPRFVSAEAFRERAATVQESLCAVFATERKRSLMDQGDEGDVETNDEDEFFIIQRAALNGLLGRALCPQCKEPGLKLKHGTKHGLAVKMVFTCTACGVDVKNAWSSPQMGKRK
ncbi:hypothetical protein HPB51_022543 [Rhipicephalus microplus]|uniref:Uncharacterized protein n=1 Tax=Rhipicephalus microplus TaxID=6941 RepID=A0A9J6DD02_RHIMP|nr:hypothetical protein HPB51_022543 [Rhipicephalus microplus]